MQNIVLYNLSISWLVVFATYPRCRICRQSLLPEASHAKILRASFLPAFVVTLYKSGVTSSPLLTLAVFVAILVAINLKETIRLSLLWLAFLLFIEES